MPRGDDQKPFLAALYVSAKRQIWRASGTLYAAVDVGVLYTTNNSGTWTTLVSGLPNIVVLGLKMYAPTRTLSAATHGRSIWSISVSSII